MTIKKEKWNKEWEQYKKIFFGKGLQKKYEEFQEYKLSGTDDDKKLIKKILETSVYHDFTFRTNEKGISELYKKSIEKMNDKIQKFLSLVKEKVLGNSNDGKTELFNSGHKKLCKNIIKLFDNKIEYGKAQKIVNMTIKYLFCFDEEGVYEEVYKYCHMPLDSYILTWLRYVVNDKLAKVLETKWDDIKWSKLDFDKYERIQVEIKKFLCDKTKNKIWPELPFYAEFYIWREEQLYEILGIISVEDFEWDIARKKDIKLKLKEAQKIIEEIISLMEPYKGSRKSKKN